MLQKKKKNITIQKIRRCSGQKKKPEKTTIILSYRFAVSSAFNAHNKNIIHSSI